MKYECAQILKTADKYDCEHGVVDEATCHTEIRHTIVADSLADAKKQICEFVGCADEAITVDACDEPGRVEAGILENVEGAPASAHEVAQWEAGNLDLWYANYSFYFEQVTRAPAVFPAEEVAA